MYDLIERRIELFDSESGPFRCLPAEKSNARSQQSHHDETAFFHTTLLLENRHYPLRSAIKVSTLKQACSRVALVLARVSCPIGRGRGLKPATNAQFELR
jgi:hypothetical protein